MLSLGSSWAQSTFPLEKNGENGEVSSMILEENSDLEPWGTFKIPSNEAMWSLRDPLREALMYTSTWDPCLLLMVLLVQLQQLLIVLLCQGHFLAVSAMDQEIGRNLDGYP